MMILLCYGPFGAAIGGITMAHGKFEKNMKSPQENIQPENSQQKTQSSKQKQPNWQQNVVLYLHDLAYLLAAIMLVFVMFFRIVIVDGTSMNQTLLHGDYLLLLSKIFYQEPEYGDIVVISKDSFDDGTPIVKRVIATEGQVVDIDFEAGIVYVDGAALDEPYTNTSTNTNGGMHFPLTVSEGCVFVMGDNRNKSRDSRYPEIGLVDEREILGKAIFLIMPGDPDGPKGPEKADWSRIGVLYD